MTFYYFDLFFKNNFNLIYAFFNLSNSYVFLKALFIYYFLKKRWVNKEEEEEERLRGENPF